MIDYIAEAMTVKTSGLFLCVMGPSGAGKSHFIGTYPGKTLLVYGQGESHGPASAIKNNKDIIPISWSQTKDGSLKPDQYIKRLKDILNPEAIVKAGFKCIAIDSLTNLCLDLKDTPVFKQKCQAKDGKHNAFKETEALIELGSKILNLLQEISEVHGIDVIVTTDLQINSVSETGIITESKPGLPTFGVGRALVQQFPEILVLGRVEGKPIFQNFAKVSSKSVDRETSTVVKYLEYNPRLRGVDELPETLEPTVKAIFDLKGE